METGQEEVEQLFSSNLWGSPNTCPLAVLATKRKCLKEVQTNLGLSVLLVSAGRTEQNYIVFYCLTLVFHSGLSSD